MDDIPPGVSRVFILYALVKQCRNLGAYKLARTAYEQLQGLHIPPRFVSSIEMGDVKIRAKPFSDSEDLLPLCYRCSTTNPLTNPRGNHCVGCQQEFIFSFATFDVLPIIQFEIEEDISDEEAIQLLKIAVPVEQKVRSSSGNRTKKRSKKDNWEEETSENVQSLKIRDDSDSVSLGSVDVGYENGHDQVSDLFSLQMSSLESIEGRRVIADRTLLSSLPSRHVFVATRPHPLRKAFFKNLVPEMNVIMCPNCHRFFLEDYESHILQEGICPFCRNKLNINR